MEQSKLLGSIQWATRILFNLRHLKQRKILIGNEWENRNKRGSYSKFLVADINKFLSSLYFYCYYKLSVKIMFEWSSVRLSFIWFYDLPSFHFYKRWNKSLVGRPAGLDSMKDFFLSDLFILSFKTERDSLLLQKEINYYLLHLTKVDTKHLLLFLQI